MPFIRENTTFIYDKNVFEFHITIDNFLLYFILYNIKNIKF